MSVFNSTRLNSKSLFFKQWFINQNGSDHFYPVSQYGKLCGF